MLRKSIVLNMAFALLFVTACEDDPASSDNNEIDQSITVSLNGGTSVTFDTPATMQAAYLVTGSGAVSDSSFYAFASESNTSSIIITFKGNNTGTYDVATMQGILDGSSNFDVGYAKSVTEIYGFSKSGSVTVTTFGAVGELVEGTYDAFVAVFDGNEPTADSARVAGTFSVLRSADGTAL